MVISRREGLEILSKFFMKPDNQDFQIPNDFF